MIRNLAFAIACLLAIVSNPAGAAAAPLPAEDQGGACLAGGWSAATAGALAPSPRPTTCGPVCSPNLYNSPTLTGYGGSCADANADLVSQSNAYLTANASTTCRTQQRSGACAEGTVVTSGCLIVVGGYYAYQGHATFGCNMSSC